MNIIDVQHVTKRFSEHVALDDISVSVPQGCVFGLLGPNGAGKTTLIRILMRISFPDKGEIFFKGHPLSEHDVYDMGYLPEERGLYKKMKTGEQAMYLAQLKGLDKQEAYKRLRAKFEQFNIMEWWNKPIEELSKGMQQKVQFITTILHRPSFLILDEPFSGFDPINANLLKDEIAQLKKEGNASRRIYSPSKSPIAPTTSSKSFRPVDIPSATKAKTTIIPASTSSCRMASLPTNFCDYLHKIVKYIPLTK